MKSNHRAAAVIIPASPNGAQSLHRLTAVSLPFQGRHSGCKIFVGRGGLLPPVVGAAQRQPIRRPHFPHKKEHPHWVLFCLPHLFFYRSPGKALTGVSI